MGMPVPFFERSKSFKPSSSSFFKDFREKHVTRGQINRIEGEAHRNIISELDGVSKLTPGYEKIELVLDPSPCYLIHRGKDRLAHPKRQPDERDHEREKKDA